ncbi:putative holin [Halomonas sp. CSM-2]|uniref:putative holin n=1 Tax=Halomonas sp. CSM-2 TaxID=1975722 RepID=UPI000A287CFD|nr:putative holin [Halomonas sp. CSM-2]
MNQKNLFDKLRIGPWLILALITTVAVGFLYPHQLGVLLWSLTKLCWGAYLGYWIDRSIFPYARTGDHALINNAELSALALMMLRRALIIAAAILALGLGV